MSERGEVEVEVVGDFAELLLSLRKWHIDYPF